MCVNNYEEVEILCQVFIDVGWGNVLEDVEYVVLWLWSIYLFVLNFQEKLGIVYLLMQDWKVFGLLMVIYGVVCVLVYC